MRKFRVAFAATMLMIMALTAGVMAATVPSNNVLGISYEYSDRGNRGEFHAIGNADYRTDLNATGVAYTQMKNVSNGNETMHVLIQEYIKDSGWNQPRSDTATLGVGETIKTVGYNRYFNKNDRYYYHTGKVYVAYGMSATYEEYSYRANQI